MPGGRGKITGKDGKPFKKGQSGNPNGRPKKLPEIDALLADVLLSDVDGKLAATAILNTLRDRAIKGDVRAAEVLLERAYGRVKQPIENSGEQTITVKIVRSHNKSERTAPDAVESSQGG